MENKVFREPMEYKLMAGGTIFLMLGTDFRELAFVTTICRHMFSKILAEDKETLS